MQNMFHLYYTINILKLFHLKMHLNHFTEKQIKFNETLLSQNIRFLWSLYSYYLR